MPIVRRDNRRIVLTQLGDYVTSLTMAELIAYEKYLWVCMTKTKDPASIAHKLNLIHREVEWRAQDT